MQRGNRRGQVFFGDHDRRSYLDSLKEICGQFEVQVLAYCLMSNHVHLIVVPPTEKAFEHVFRRLSTRHAQRINRLRQLSGHVWQGRYFSSPLDEAYLWNALRYVERNPVRAGIVARADHYPWSSAPAHCGRRTDELLTTEPDWLEFVGQVGDWAAWLSEEDSPAILEVLRTNSRRNQPCGSDSFVAELERRAGVPLRERPRGGSRKRSGGTSKDFKGDAPF